MINLDYQSRTPIYQQIVQEIERFVVLDILKPDEQIPSIRELASTLGVNPNTIKKAYDILEQKGIIVTLSTKGTFIAQKREIAADEIINDKIKKLREEITELEKYGVSREEILKRLS